MADKSFNIKFTYKKALRVSASSIRGTTMVDELIGRIGGREVRRLKTVNFRLHSEIKELREELQELKEEVRELGGRFVVSPFPSSLLPVADWRDMETDLSPLIHTSQEPRQWVIPRSSQDPPRGPYNDLARREPDSELVCIILMQMGQMIDDLLRGIRGEITPRGENSLPSNLEFGSYSLHSPPPQTSLIRRVEGGKRIDEKIAKSMLSELREWRCPPPTPQIRQPKIQGKGHGRYSVCSFLGERIPPYT